MVSHFANFIFEASFDSKTFNDDDWDEIYSCLVDIDMELMTKGPCVSHAHDVSFSAKAKNDPDSPMFHEAITGEHADDYWIVMDKEIKGLGKRNTWTCIPRSLIGKDHPQGPVLPSTWALKVKHKVDFSFRTFKAQFCVRGDVQK